MARTTAPAPPVLDPMAHLEELRQRVLDGDTTVTAVELATAEQAAHLATLRAAGQRAADDRQAQVDAHAAHEGAIAQVHADAEAAAGPAGDLALARAAYRALVDSAQTLDAAIARWDRTRDDILGRADRLDQVIDSDLVPDLRASDVTGVRLSRWVSRALEEARGRYDWGTHGHFAHALHDAEARAHIAELNGDPPPRPPQHATPAEDEPDLDADEQPSSELEADSELLAGPASGRNVW